MARLARRLSATIAVLLMMFVGLEPTKAVAAAPPAVQNLSAYAMTGAVRLQWENPASPDLASTVVVVRPGTVAPTSLTDGHAYPPIDKAFSAKIVDFRVPGISYSFTVFPLDSLNNPGPGTSITVFGSSLSLSVSRTGVGYGSAVTLRGRLLDADTGFGPSGEEVEIYARERGTRAWEFVTSVITGAGGAFGLTDRPPVNAEYEAFYYGSDPVTSPAFPNHFGDVAGPVGVSVSPAVSLRANRTTVARGGTVTLTTVVGPRHAGQKVYLQRLVGRVWHTVATRALSSASAASFPVRLTAPGTYKYRVYKPADSDHVASFSRVVAVRAI